MTLDPSRIQSIVADVLDQLERGGAAGDAKPLGVHATLDQAVEAARQSFALFRDVTLEQRGRIIAEIRRSLLGHLDTLGSLGVEETGLGRVEDKVLKNRLVIEKPSQVHRQSVRRRIPEIAVLLQTLEDDPIEVDR